MAVAWNRCTYAFRVSTDISLRSPRQFYIRPAGSDSNPGTSPELAWKTIEKVNRQSFVPGDSILFEAGQQFLGNLVLSADDRGTASRPIKIGSFGSRTATIIANSHSAVLIHNTGGISIQNLKITGAGDAENGIMLLNDVFGGVKIPFIRIDSIDISGFSRFGIGVQGNLWGSGFRDLRITHVVAHNNLLAGIYTLAPYSSFLAPWLGHPHRDIYIADSEAYSNSGIEGADKENTGSGIVVSAVDNGIIERNLAYNNGFKSNSKAGGPVGIWAWDADSIKIQFNRSFNNRTNGAFDGGGFDLDGGVTHSVLKLRPSRDRKRETVWN